MKQSNSMDLKLLSMLKLRVSGLISRFHNAIEAFRLAPVGKIPRAEAQIAMMLGVVIIRWAQVEREFDFAIGAARGIDTSDPIGRHPMALSQKLAAVKRTLLGSPKFAAAPRYITDTIDRLDRLLEDRHTLIHGFSEKTEDGPHPFIRFERLGFDKGEPHLRTLDVSENYLRQLDGELRQIRSKLEEVQVITWLTRIEDARRRQSAID